MNEAPRQPAVPPALGGFGEFALEQFPFAAAAASAALESVAPPADRRLDAQAIDDLRRPFATALEQQLSQLAPAGLGDTTPRVAAAERFAQAVEAIRDACDGFLRRAAIKVSLTAGERREILRGMLLTRATDNRLKTFFTSGEVRFREAPFQGKGFRSLGQEAIYAAGIRLRRGEQYRAPEGWTGDVVAPIIRDLGAALAMRPSPETVRMVLSAQMAKAGPPMDGKDLHVGDLSWGILPASAPLATGTLTLAGMALAFAREGSGRVAVSFIGEGGASLGEWHEAINLCAARKLPAVFCLENNQTALSTPVHEQSAARVFADKAAGYGIPGITIDGTDADGIAAAFAWAVERARAGLGPALIELVAMRMCGHAHHDDMLYLGRETPPAWQYSRLGDGGYADRDAYAYWSGSDPIARYAERLLADGIIGAGDVEQWKTEVVTLVEREAQAVIAADWPDPSRAGTGVVANEPPRVRVEVLDPAWRRSVDPDPALPAVDPGAPFDRHGTTFLDGVAAGVRDALIADPRVFVFGEDVGGTYGNAFLLLRPLLQQFGDRLINSTLAEGAVLGVCVGAALAGQRPIGEMQFNDFVATGFNQLVNNAAKIRYRWGGEVPMVVRMPWGGLRHAGPYHSQNTEPWFYRTPGLKIVVPSTPHDARALMASAVADPDPVLFYEHIALYRDPRIKQALSATEPGRVPLGSAALRRAGSDVAMISYGAYVHACLRVADVLAARGIHASVLDLRSLAPLDRASVLAVARHCSRVLIVHEDSRTGGIGESLAAIIQEEAFESLDAPVRILGALDTPVPYSPPLEQRFLPSEAEIEQAAVRLVEYRPVDLAEARRRASELSGGISSEPIKSLILRVLDREAAKGSLLDFGAGTGELLARLHDLSRFDRLAGVDLFPRPASLPPAVAWHQQDLNDVVDVFATDGAFDTVICSETIEHLENPRHVFRSLRRLVRPGGLLVLTMPNQESIRSYAGLIFAGHFTHFLAACYPAHITALLRLDLTRICTESGFTAPAFAFTDDGAIPKLARVHWQQISFGLLRGRLFSDNVCMVTRAPADLSRV